MRNLCFMVALLTFAGHASAERFQAPSGHLGAGLSTSEVQTGRVYAEMGVFADDYRNAFPLVFGGGFKPVRFLELRLALPIAIGEVDGGRSSDLGGVTIGNVQLGVDALFGNDTVRFKGGAALSFGPWTSENTRRDRFWAMALSGLLRPEDLVLWRPETLGLATPLRLEINPVEHFLISADGGFSFFFSENDRPPVADLNFAPGFGYVSQVLDAGARFLVRLQLAGPNLENADRAQTALEPFLRVNLGQAFLHSRFTVFLDRPLGFAFDDAGVWALHFGGGAGF